MGVPDAERNDEARYDEKYIYTEKAAGEQSAEVSQHHSEHCYSAKYLDVQTPRSLSFFLIHEPNSTVSQSTFFTEVCEAANSLPRVFFDHSRSWPSKLDTLAFVRFRKILKKAVRRLPLARRPFPTTSSQVSSFPFISADTFRLMAGVEIRKDAVVEKSALPGEIVFATTEVSRQDDFQARLQALVDCGKVTSVSTLLIHDGDVRPPMAVLNACASLVGSIYCVNVVSETESVRALPIGLENARLHANGRLNLYIDDMDLPPLDQRDRMVLSSFHPETNPTVREVVAREMAESRHGFDGVRWKLGEYRQELRRTLFVISPPGNGVDCHRTWEALALGAIPVVLRSALAPSLSENMPMLVVDSYEDFARYSDEELKAIALEVKKSRPSKLLAGYWLNLLHPDRT